MGKSTSADRPDLSYKEIYDMVYENLEDYNKPTVHRNRHIDMYINQFILENKHDTILDVGCGAGHLLRKYHDQGLNITGIEVSTICCNKYLSGLNYYNIDVIDFANSVENKYDVLYCKGTLEHIRFEDLDLFLKACKKLSNRCLFGIANHVSWVNGIRLHVIRRNVPWWLYTIAQHFKVITEIGPERRSKYYIIKGENSE